MSDKKFNVGDIVTVREWEDMESEHTTDMEGDIYFEEGPIYFVRQMRHLCGQSYEVAYVENFNDVCEMTLRPLDSDDCLGYTFLPGMLIRADDVLPESEIEVDRDSFFGIAFDR